MNAFGGDFEQSALDRLAAADQAYQRMIAKLTDLERGWDAKGGEIRHLQDTVIDVSVALFEFARNAGLTRFGLKFCNHLVIALGELQSGRHSALLQPSQVPSNQLAPTDIGLQGVAHACVQTLRGAGLRADESRREVAKVFGDQGFKKFSTHTLRNLHTRLTGPGSTADPSFNIYSFTREQLDRSLADKTVGKFYHPDHARAAVKVIAKKMRARDHRLDFYSAPRSE